MRETVKQCNDRLRIERDIKEYLNNGGKIRTFNAGETGTDPAGKINRRDFTISPKKPQFPRE